MTKTLAAIATTALLALAPLAANAHGGHRDWDDRGHRHNVHHHHHHHHHGHGYGYHGRTYDDDRRDHRGYRAPVVVYPAPVAVYPAPRMAQVHVPPVIVPFPHLSVRIGF